MDLVDVELGEVGAVGGEELQAAAVQVARKQVQVSQLPELTQEVAEGLKTKMLV